MEEKEETDEERRERLAREDWRRRQEESHRFREEVYRRNGMLKEGETLVLNPVGGQGRCCGRK